VTKNFLIFFECAIILIILFVLLSVLLLKSKRNQLASFEHRLAMCQLAFQDIPHVTVSDAEFQIVQQKKLKKQKNRNKEPQQPLAQQSTNDASNISVGTADLLEYYLALEGGDDEEEGTTVEFTLCLGADTFLDLTSGTWRRTQDILDLLQGRLVVLHRATSTTSALVTTAAGDGIDDNNMGDDSYHSNSSSDSEANPSVLMDMIQRLNDKYGANSAQYLRLPTLGAAVSSTLLRRTRSSSSSFSRQSSSDFAAVTGLVSNTTTGGASSGDSTPPESIASPQELSPEQLPQMVYPSVLEYMRQHHLYGLKREHL
jgi:nicotinic acid mononucleotide adenylyltransferase